MNLFGNYSYGAIFIVIALVHFARRRPEYYWLWIIIMGGGLGAIVYIVVEVLPGKRSMRNWPGRICRAISGACRRIR